MKKAILAAAVALVFGSCANQLNTGALLLKDGTWHASVWRPDGQPIVFNFEVTDSARHKVLYILNAGDRMRVDSVRRHGDTIFIHMPFFNSDFWGHFQNDGSLKGYWVRHLPGKDLAMPFTARPDAPYRFSPHPRKARFNVSGRWATTFYEDGDTSTAVGEFLQKGNQVVGTFLTISGDDRFLQGEVDGDTLKLSTFDGSNAYVFTAPLTSDSLIEGGQFYAGYQGHATWVARKDSSARLPNAFSLTSFRPGENTLHFAFPDLNGDTVSLSDPVYRGKVVIVQIMGSWCPNCMDETRFLSRWYRANHSRGVEIIGLCYERTTDFKQSVASVMTFKNLFHVGYKMLITGVTATDPDMLQKTLPEIQHFVGFPTTIFIGRDGRIQKIHAGFSGPGTGEHYVKFKREFNAVVDSLLQEKA